MKIQPIARKIPDFDIPPEEHNVQPPPGGWKPETWYEVVISVRHGNPPFLALAFTGFLKPDGSPENLVVISVRHGNPPFLALAFTGFLKPDGSPGNYSGIFTSRYAPEGSDDIFHFYHKNLYLRVRGELVVAVADKEEP